MGTFQTPSETGENPDSAQNFRRNYPEKTSANNVRRNTENLGGAGSRASHTLNSRLVRGCSRLSSAQGSAADTWTQNARLRSCRALRVCRYDSWGAIGDHARIFLASVPKRRR